MDISREEFARAAEEIFKYSPSKKPISGALTKWHWGKQEIRRLADKLYGGPPVKEEEFINFDKI